MQVPLLDSADTLTELQTYLASHKCPTELPEQVKKGHAKAQAMAQARLPSEQSVAPERPADTELLANYMAYIKLEEVSLLASCW